MGSPYLSLPSGPLSGAGPLSPGEFRLDLAKVLHGGAHRVAWYFRLVISLSMPDQTWSSARLCSADISRSYWKNSALESIAFTNCSTLSGLKGPAKNDPIVTLIIEKSIGGNSPVVCICGPVGSEICEMLNSGLCCSSGIVAAGEDRGKASPADSVLSTSSWLSGSQYCRRCLPPFLPLLPPFLPLPLGETLLHIGGFAAPRLHCPG